MKKILLVFILLLQINFVSAEIVIEKLEDPPYLNPDGTIYTPQKTNNSADNSTVKKTMTEALSEAVLSKLEQKTFGRAFAGDFEYNRLCRLEKQIFGAIQTGDSKTRLQRLIVASRGYSNDLAQKYYPYPNTAYNRTNSAYDPYTPYNPYGNRGKIRNFLRSLSGGTLTGYSPPVNGYYNTQSGYNSPYSGYQAQTPSFNGMNIFSNGASGQETYWDDGQYQRHLKSNDGGIGVKVFY